MAINETSYMAWAGVPRMERSEIKYISLDKEKKLKKICDIVACLLNVSVDEIRAKERGSIEVSYARHVCILVISMNVEITLKRIGRFFSGRDHSTIFVAREKIRTKLRDNDTDTKNLLQKIDAILQSPDIMQATSNAELVNGL